MKRNWTDEELMAWADGELAPDEARALEAALGADPALASRAALFTRTRTDARAAFAGLLGEAVPPALGEAVRRMAAQAAAPATGPEPEAPGAVLPFVPRARRPFSKAWATALAASLAAASVGGLLGYRVATGEPSHFEGMLLTDVNDAALDSALLHVASGRETPLDGDGRFRAIATFRDGDGSLCREFEVDLTGGTTVVSVACRMSESWRTRFAVLAPGAENGYAPASSAEALEAYLAAIEAGTPLGEGEEIAALSAVAE